MISSVLRHLESLHVELMAIDPAHRTDAADKVAALASDLRQLMADAMPADRHPTIDRACVRHQAAA